MGRRRKKKSALDDLFDMLFELTGYFWQVGAVVSLLLSFATYKSLVWAISFNIQTATSSPSAISIFKNISWIFYSVPIMFGLFTIIFLVKTYKVYVGEDQF